MGGRGAVCAKSLLPVLSTRLSPLRRISHLVVRMASPDPPAPPPPSSSSSSSAAVDFLSLCHRLKVSSPLGHSFLSFLNVACVKMALVHDIAEGKTVCSKLLCLHIFLYFAAKEIDELWMEYEDNSSPEAKLVKDFDKVHFYMLLSGGVEMILQALEYEDGKSKELTWKNFLSLLQLQLSQVNDAMLKLPVLNFCSTLKCHICFAGKFQTDIGKAWASEIASRRKRGK
ncbi:hypothetical protein BHE74_00049504 [Ensete ventricosum]|nr:hypothetical protein GW17_00054614 [Ensete ventricosum]RWW44718.1 hypothetical protein BHE74_00049504 [Ensete ventricosum]